MDVEPFSVGYTYLTIAILAFAILGLSYKLSDRLKCHQPQVNFSMFLFGLALMAVWAIQTRSISLTPAAIAIGAACGINSFINVRAFREASAKGRISTSFTILQLSLVVPVLASIVIWGEAPDIKRCAGLALTAVAILLLGIDMRKCEE